MVIENAEMMRPHCVLLRPIARRTAGASNTNLLRPMYLKVVIGNIETTGSQGSILANADRFGVAEACTVLVEQSMEFLIPKSSFSAQSKRPQEIQDRLFVGDG